MKYRGEKGKLHFTHEKMWMPEQNKYVSFPTLD